VAGGVYENSPHGLGSGREEVAAMVPMRPRPIPDQAQVGFVNESGRLQCLPRLLQGKSLGSQQAQLIVNKREQLGPCVGIAAVDGIQEASNFAHDGLV
jgi:hypothetical protein